MAQSEPNLVAKLVSRWLTVAKFAERDGRASRIVRRWVNRYRDLIDPGDTLRGDTLRGGTPRARTLHGRALAAPALDVPELAAASFRGPIADIPIAELVQTIAMGRKDCVITVRHEGRESRIWCLGGNIVDAECGRLTGDLAFYRIAALDHGYVFGDFRSVPRLRIIHASTQALLLEGARRKDQCELLRKRIGDTHSVYSPTDKALSGGRHGRSALAVLRAFYPGATLDEVLLDVHIGDLQTLRLVVAFVEEGWLAPNPELSAERLTLPPAEVLLERATLNSLGPYLAGERLDRGRSTSKGTLMLASALAVAIVVIGISRAWAPASEASRAVPAGQSLPTPSAPDQGSSGAAGPDSAGVLAAEAPPASPAELRVEVEAAPKDATWSFDGGPAKTGRIALRLPRDGRTHELRVAAAGYETARVLFSDAAPPALIELVATADSLPPEPDPGASARRIPALRRIAARPKAVSTGLDELASTQRRRTGELDRGRALSTARAPRVKILTDEDPNVLVLE